MKVVKGFTLIELMIVVAIVFILLAIVFGTVVDWQEVSVLQNQEIIYGESK